MSEAAAVTAEPIEAEEVEQPITAATMVGYLVQDIQTGGDPADFASDVIDNFVLITQPESGQILTMLDMDTATLIQLLKAFMNEGLKETAAAIDRDGPKFIDGVKASLKEQLSAMAAGASE